MPVKLHPSMYAPALRGASKPLYILPKPGLRRPTREPPKDGGAAAVWGVQMARIVQKFGGTSVADIDRIRAVAERVKKTVDDGNQVAVVVSAMSGTTNQLVEWTRDISPMHDAREYDVVVSAGEQITVVRRPKKSQTTIHISNGLMEEESTSNKDEMMMQPRRHETSTHAVQI